MRKKIIVISIMTLAVIIGGWLYYDNLMTELLKGPKGYYIVNGMDNNHVKVPTIEHLASTAKLPKYKVSSRGKIGSDSLPVIIDNLTDPSLSAPKGITKQRVGIKNSNYQVGNSGNKIAIYNTGGAGGLLAHSSGKGSLSSTSGAGANTSGIGGPVLLPPTKSGNFTAANGYTDITSADDDTDDGLPPPVGTPVGEGLMVLLALAGVYIFYKRRF